MLADVGRGSSPNLKFSCQMASDQEEDASLVPTWAVGQESPASSWILISLDGRGGLLEGASLVSLGG